MLPLTSGTVASLGNLANSAIASALAHGGFHTNAPKGEVAAVATVTLDGVPAIATAWRPVLAALGYTVTMTSVFCHSTPKVSFNGKSCELGDLLVVVDETATLLPQKVLDRRAVLIQAKIAKSSKISISGKALDQLDLYEHWHTFKLPGGYPMPQSRDLRVFGQPGHWDETGRYGGIELTAPHGWTQVPPAPSPMVLLGGLPLGLFIAEMAEGSSGRAAIAGNRDDWSATVDDLLTVTGAATFVAPNATPGGAGPRPRSVVVMPSMSGVPISSSIPEEEEDDEDDGDDGRIPPPTDGEERRPDGPISTIHIRLSRRD